MLCLIEGERSRDEHNWNRTSAHMSLLAQINSKKGQNYTPADFHPYLKSKKGKGEYDVSTKEGIMKLAERLKKF